MRLLEEGYGLAYMSIIVSLCLYFLLSASSVYAAEEMSPAELDKWFEQDSDLATDEISEGELRFLPEKPAKPALHSLNKLVISPSSIDDGWVSMSQCYQNLDPVSASEVVYQYKEMRNLKIVSYKNIVFFINIFYCMGYFWGNYEFINLFYWNFKIQYFIYLFKS